MSDFRAEFHALRPELTKGEPPLCHIKIVATPQITHALEHECCNPPIGLHQAKANKRLSPLQATGCDPSSRVDPDHHQRQVAETELEGAGDGSVRP
jgi:hypothetical protein